MDQVGRQDLVPDIFDPPIMRRCTQEDARYKKIVHAVRCITTFVDIIEYVIGFVAVKLSGTLYYKR